MKLNKVPIKKIGTPYQRPSWRFDAIQHPKRYGLLGYLSDKKNDAGYLKRLLVKGVPVDKVFTLPSYISRIGKNLPVNLSSRLYTIFQKHYLKQNKKKISFTKPKIISWNINKIQEFNDVWFKKLVLHVMNFEYDENIEFALKLHLQEENQELKKFIGFSIFAGISDKEICQRWQVSSPKKIEAIRNLFFDFSTFPKDKLACWSMLKQMAKIGEISDEDLSYYKRIYDLGEVGLKALVSFLHLSPEEQRRIEQYLGKTPLMNTYKLDFHVKNMGDAVQYSKVIRDLGMLQLQHELKQQKALEMEHTRLSIDQMREELSLDADKTENLEDVKLLETFVKDMTKHNAEPKYTSIIELQQIAQPKEG